ncbi:hypothetical protein [Coraliomargarita parva]|uniref:hypothetical protein n=1 Tax=Coraliomargarita parva TaxID=3014050 RepID=UPI0022B2DFB0|nr:hypothetical protein [Coraliomargarita parva]
METTEFMFGVAAQLPSLEARDFSLMKDAGIGCLRFGDFKFDLAAFVQGRPQGEGFRQASARVRDLCGEGFRLIGITPGPREMAAVSLEPGSHEYYQAYDRICRFLAETFGEWIQWWQVANELDIWIFRDQLDLVQSVKFLKTGIRAMKSVRPDLKVGINITLFPSLPGEVDGNTDAHEGLVVAEGIYGDPTLPVDYAGFDSYPGSWREGGPESWHAYLDDFHALTGKPVLVQEFGYASAGGIMSPEEAASGLYPCESKKWKFHWRGEHSEAVQAAYLQESLRIFRGKPFVLGAIYYNWRDAKRCWQCKKPDCPAETAWGLLDQEGQPKLSYETLKKDFMRSAE